MHAEAFPASQVLREIIVVDDGSEPPLEQQWPRAAEYKVRFIRHNTTRGLMMAKQSGGDAAKGDVIVPRIPAAALVGADARTRGREQPSRGGPRHLEP